MPFTLAHPVAVWPLARSRTLLLLPLLVGSVTPDLPDYMPGVIARHFTATHSVLGSLVQDLPLGLLTLLGLVLLRGPLTVLLGPRTRTLFHDPLERFARTPRSWGLAPLSVFVGIWTHLLWDSFTHEEGWMVQFIPWLSRPVTVLGHSGELAHLLQYISSVAGMLLLFLWYRSCVSALPVPRPLPEDRRRLQVLAGVAAAAVLIGVAQALGPAHGQSMYRVHYLLLTRTLAWFGVLYLAAGTTVSLWQRWTSGRVAAEGQAPGP